MEDWVRLSKVLLSHSKKGTLTWNKSGTSGEFGVTLPRGSVKISRRQSSNFGGDQPEILVEVYDKKGKLVEDFTDEILQATDFSVPDGRNSWFGYLDDIYKAARRSASGADIVFKEIIEDIENGDDIPF